MEQLKSTIRKKKLEAKTIFLIIDNKRIQRTDKIVKLIKHNEAVVFAFLYIQRTKQNWRYNWIVK